MGDVLTSLEAIRQALDLAGNVRAFVAANIGVIAAALQQFIFRTGNPASPNAAFTTVGPIRSYTPAVQALADTALTAVVTWASLRMMWGRVTTRSQFVLRVMIPRLLLAALLINFAVPLVQAAVDGSNALCDSVMRITGEQILADTRDIRIDPLIGLQGVAMLLLFAAYAVLAFAYVIRFALLVVLTILAPAAALLFVLPETQRYAREWSGLFIGALLMQPLQLLVLAIGFALDGYSLVPIRHLFAVAAVFMAFKVPGALRSASLAGSKASSMVKRHMTHAVHAAMKA